MRKNKKEAYLIILLGITAVLLIMLYAILAVEGRTYFIPIFATSTPSVTRSHVSVLVVGDIMLDRNVRNLISRNGFDAVFAGVKDMISNADIAVGNLEGPITDNPSKTADLINKELTFTFDSSVAGELAGLGFDVFGLGNNHTLNFGQDGLTSTRERLHLVGIQTYGDPNNTDELSTIVARNGLKIGFVGYHEFSYEGLDRVLAEIDRIRPLVDVLIVTPHWGVEYQREPTTLMQTLAHEFIDHGADVVIGAHPHIVGDTEVYQGKNIYYSLGNFAFDQYFSEATMNGLAVIVDVNKVSDETGTRMTLTFTDIPVRSDRNGVYIQK